MEGRKEEAGPKKKKKKKEGFKNCAGINWLFV